MVHAPRVQYPGAIHHITSRGSSRAPIFHTDRDYAVFVAMLAAAQRAAGWHCLAYCLMPNHYHLLVETPRTSLSEGMHRLNGTYAARYNAAHGHTGHVFQGRFHAELVKRDAHLLEAFRYIVLNPVRASVARCPDAWRWSSYRATAGLCASPGWLASERVLAHFGRNAADSCRRYREFVMDGASVRRPQLADLIRSNSRAGIIAARDDYGYTQAEIAAHLGVSQPTVSRILRKAAAPE